MFINLAIKIKNFWQNLINSHLFLSIMIRKMTEADLNSVCYLYEDANKFTNHSTILCWTKANREKFPQQHLVYEVDGQIIGAISGIFLNQEELSIEDIAVNEKCRGQKIGSKLIEEMLKKLSKENIKKVSLWVHWTDARAIPFYYKYGFKICGVERTKGREHVPDGEDIILMEKLI